MKAKFVRKSSTAQLQQKLNTTSKLSANSESISQLMQSVEKIPLNRIKLQRSNVGDQSSDHGSIKMLPVKSKITIEKKVSP
jgi:hypothetical protein